ncbi:MAG: D-aminoacylase [Anaerolineales bacterium]|jgi:N-acyl-D-amino-acid deacylase
MPDFDYVIKNGKLVDGTGAPWRYAHLAIADGKIAAIGKNIDTCNASTVIDAGGKIVCPGFIDAHSHMDILLLADERMEYRITQGITTEVVGQDGLSYAPVSPVHLQEWRKYLTGLNGDYGDRVTWDWTNTAELLTLYKNRSSNVIHLIPHGAVRVEVMGWEARPATKGELDRMQELVRQSLHEGAAGISTGLTYIPCSHATTEEMIALCQPVGEVGGVLHIHLRSYAEKVLEAVEEAIEIGRQSGAAIQLSHMRMAVPSTWGLSGKVLTLVEDARVEGIDVTYDIYPYTFGCAPLFCLIPDWAQAGGPDVVLDRLKDDKIRDQIIKEISQWQIEWSYYTLSNLPEIELGAWEGFRLTEAADELGISVFEFMLDVLLQTQLDASIVADGGSEEDNMVMLSHPAGMIGSDGVMVGGKPHPRGYGTYPRLFEKYVRDDKSLRLEEVIHKMSGMPAARHNLNDRGILAVGQSADIVGFSLEEIKSNATFEDALQTPDGIDTVLINGKAAVLDGKYLGSNFGKVLRPLI